MTIAELTKTLADMPDEEFRTFCGDFGGGQDQTRDDVVRCYVDRPEVERRMCQLLDLIPESEKMTAASIESATAAAESARAAHRSLILATIAIIVAIIGLVVAACR